jgi:long-chain acyl-CoA synthetase
MATRLGVLQGYGLTETAGGTCINHPDRNRYWTAGEPLGMQIKIAEDGEIMIKGPALMTGYYRQPEETAKVIDPDGWFHSGDIGEMEGGNLKITDRKKDLIVLGNGKNVAPQPIENKLKVSPFIAEAVVMGDGMEACVALIVPNFEAVRKELGLPESTLLSTSEEARKLIKREIDGINKGLAPFEMVKRHAILDEAFSQETGELTPSMKVKRKVIREKFATQIGRLRS